MESCARLHPCVRRLSVLLRRKDSSAIFGQRHGIDALRQTDAQIKFLSLEPLLGALPSLTLEGIDWVIVGGESGPGAREMQKKWVIDIRDQCADANVLFFFKQWGGRRKSKTGRKLDGRTYDEIPI